MTEQKLAEATEVSQQASLAKAAAISMKAAAEAREAGAKEALPKAIEKASVASQMLQNAEKEHRTASTTLDLAETAMSENGQQLELLRTRSETTKTDLVAIDSKISRAKKTTASKAALRKVFEPILTARLTAKADGETSLKQLQNEVIKARDAVQNQTITVRESETSAARTVVAAKAAALRETKAVEDVAGKAATENDAVASDGVSKQQLGIATKKAKANTATANRLVKQLTDASSVVEDQLETKKAAAKQQSELLDRKLKTQSVSKKAAEAAADRKEHETQLQRAAQTAGGKYELARGASMDAQAKAGQTADRVPIAQGVVQEAQEEEVLSKQEVAVETNTAGE